MKKKQHAGLIVRAPSPDRVEELLGEYTRRFYEDFHASAPPPDEVTA